MAFDTRTTLPGSQNVQRPGLTPTGAVAQEENVRVSVMLRRRSESRQGLAADFGRLLHLTAESHAEEYGAAEADVQLVEQFAHDKGLSVIEASAPKRRLVLAGTAEEMQNAFGASLVLYKDQESGQTYRGREGTISIPQELRGVVTAVLGFDMRPVAKPHFRMGSAPVTTELTGGAVGFLQTPSGSFTPQQVAALYNFPKDVTGKGQTIAIIELGGGYRAADLQAYFTGMKLAVPSVTAVSVDGGKNTPGSDADGEVLLDIEVVGAIANGANIAVYFAPNTDKGFVDAITEAVHDTRRKPSIISISWGGPEDSWSEQSRNAMNSALQDAASLGITVMAASGDNGSSDGVSDGKLHVDFPASSPFILACGGTTLRGSGASISSETVWNETANQQGATGGGVSTAFALPAYQKSANVPKQAQTSFVGRGVPDVAGNADPVTGYQVRINGQNTVIGGTSAVAPLWAALIALLNQKLGRSAGFINPKIYVSPTGAFHDITSGNNDDAKLGAYPARTGWDACTGLGSPIGPGILQVLSSASGAQRSTIPGSSPQHDPAAEWTPVESAEHPQVAATILLRSSGEDQSQRLLAGTAPALPHGTASLAVSASPEAVQQVVAFAKEHGLQVTEASASTRTVKVQGTPEQLGDAFGVQLELVKDPDGATYLSHRESISTPASLCNLIVAVLGLDQRPIAKHHGAHS